MRATLSGLRQRVERLATDANRSVCGGNHRRTEFSHIFSDEPRPSWPEAALGERCACGEQIEFFHVVNVYAGTRYDAEVSRRLWDRAE